MNNPGELLNKANELLNQGQLMQAREVFVRVSELDPSNAETWLMLGAIDGESGRMEAALRSIRHAIKVKPDYEEAYLTLAGMQQRQGQLEEALQSCFNALEIDPCYEEAWLMQSGIQGALAYYEDSEKSSRRVVELWPECVDAYVNLGNALKAQGKWQEAVDSYRKVLEIQPDQVPVMLELGYMFLEQDKLEEASNSFSQVLQRQPRNADAKLAMAGICQRKSDPESAIAYCQASVNADPGKTSAYLTLCEALLSADRLEEAEAVYTSIPAQDKNDIAVVLVQSHILQRKGDYQQAFDLLNKFKAQYCDHPDFVSAFADISRHTKRIDEGGALVEKQLERKSLSVSEKKKLHFSLGRLYDAEGQYSKAFEQFQQANKLKLAVFDHAKHSAAIDRLIRAYSHDALGRLPRAGNRSQLPVFIVGMPRSGTTLVEQILCSHSAVAGAGELPYIGQMAIKLAGEINSTLSYPECVQFLTQDTLDSLARGYLARLKKRSETAARISDKQNGNYLHLGLIQLLFPEARVIHCMRDPMDVCLSLYTHDMGGEATYTRTFEDLAFYYGHYQRLMSHWQGLLKIPVLNFHYEALVQNQEEKTRELLEFCDLPWDSRCLNFHENRRLVDTPSHAQVRQPLYSGSIGRWKNYLAYLSPLQSLLTNATGG